MKLKKFSISYANVTVTHCLQMGGQQSKPDDHSNIMNNKDASMIVRKTKQLDDIENELLMLLTLTLKNHEIIGKKGNLNKSITKLDLCIDELLAVITPFSLKNGTVKTKKFEEKKLTFNCEKA